MYLDSPEERVKAGPDGDDLGVLSRFRQKEINVVADDRDTCPLI